MRNKIIIGTLILSTAFQATIPAYASKESAGNVIGGVVGGLIGSQIGKGSRHGGVNGVGMILGAITGSIIGGVIGRELDEADRKAFYDAQMQGLNGGLNQRCEWNGSRYGSRTGVSGNFTTFKLVNIAGLISAL